jgi:hypothetical protein
MTNCTLPSWFGFGPWFDKRFGEICDEHDNDYVMQALTRKQCDLKVLSGIAMKGYPWLGVVAYVYCRALGWVFWYRRQFKRMVP